MKPLVSFLSSVLLSLTIYAQGATPNPFEELTATNPGSQTNQLSNPNRQEETGNQINQAAGLPFADAQSIMDAIANKKKGIGNILKVYDDSLGTNYEKDLEYLKERNPFLYIFLQGHVKSQNYLIDKEVIESPIEAEATSFLGGGKLFSEDAIIKGLAAFIAERVKEELITSYLNKFIEVGI